MPNLKSLPPPDELREMIYYEDGEIYWYEQYRGASRRTDKPIGSLNQDGYKRTRLKINDVTRDYTIHRLVWWLHNNEWPDIIDHVNRDRSDNRIENLRTANGRENSQNCNPRKRNQSGYVGVCRQHGTKHYKAYIQLNGYYMTSYGYKTREAAALARDFLSALFFGEFANFNIIDKSSLSVNGSNL